jgi:hypothetical protein
MMIIITSITTTIIPTSAQMEHIRSCYQETLSCWSRHFHPQVPADDMMTGHVTWLGLVQAWCSTLFPLKAQEVTNTKKLQVTSADSSCHMTSGLSELDVLVCVNFMTLL